MSVKAARGPWAAEGPAFDRSEGPDVATLSVVRAGQQRPGGRGCRQAGCAVSHAQARVLETHLRPSVVTGKGSFLLALLSVERLDFDTRWPRQSGSSLGRTTASNRAPLRITVTSIRC